MNQSVQHVDFTLKGWDGDPKLTDEELVRVTFRGALEYRLEDTVTEESAKAFAVDMVRRYRDDLSDDFWDQPLTFEWTVETVKRGDYGSHTDTP